MQQKHGVVWKIYPWNKLASVKFHTITAVGEGRWECISLHLLCCAVQLFVRISSRSSAGYLLSSKASLNCSSQEHFMAFKARGVCVCVCFSSSLTLPSGEEWLYHSLQVLCVQGRQLACWVHRGYLCCAVLVHLCKLLGDVCKGKWGLSLEMASRLTKGKNINIALPYHHWSITLSPFSSRELSSKSVEQCLKKASSP